MIQERISPYISARLMGTLLGLNHAVGTISRRTSLLSYRPSPGTVFFVGYGSAMSERNTYRFQDLTRPVRWLLHEAELPVQGLIYFYSMLLSNGDLATPTAYDEKFERVAPLVLEVGFGDGHFLEHLSSATSRMEFPRR